MAKTFWNQNGNCPTLKYPNPDQEDADYKKDAEPIL